MGVKLYRTNEIKAKKRELKKILPIYYIITIDKKRC